MSQREILLRWLCLFLFAGLIGAFTSAWCAPLRWVDESVARDGESGARLVF